MSIVIALLFPLISIVDVAGVGTKVNDEIVIAKYNFLWNIPIGEQGLIEVYPETTVFMNPKCRLV